MNVPFWCFVGGETPVSIPNTEVKPTRADDTLRGKVGRRQDGAFIAKHPAKAGCFDMIGGCHGRQCVNYFLLLEE